MQRQTRRDLIKATSAAVAGIAAALPSKGQRSPEGAKPNGAISVRLTAGEKRFVQAPALQWVPQQGRGGKAIVVDPGTRFQEVLGFGAALTDSACYTLSQMPAAARDQLLQEFFGPSQMGLSVCRICMGSSDYARDVYSFDEGAPDPELKRFSIDHDREYILPVLQSARKVNPDLYLLASPWSPPGWMKPNNSMLGGCAHPLAFPAYARYFVKFLQDYSAAGVPVNAVTVQNEVDTEQNGRMPACLFAQEYEMGFVADHLGPLFAKDGIKTKIWILDHNYSLWGRAICELDEPKVSQFVDGIAWHGYVGEPSAMTRVHEAHPDKHAYWTEGGPDITDPHYATDWANWGTTFAGILRNWARCIIAWNLALDENGKPNIGPFTCGGVVTVDSKTKEITRSGQHWAFAHYSSVIRRGAFRLDSTGDIDGLSHVVFANPDGSKAAVLANKGKDTKVRLRMSGAETEVSVPGDSLMSLTWA
jgi:glucosylceramidase